jgi:hypothetical protein
MLNGAPRALFKEAKIAILHWSLWSKPLENKKSVIFNLKLSFFSILNQCPGDTD